MLSPDSYVKYLESIVLSLIDNEEKNIPITDETSVMHGFECSTINVKIEISDQRDKRKDLTN
jgi:hypothetical protein